MGAPRLSWHRPWLLQVKTTSPKKYCVRPSSGIVEPGSSKEVQVIMQAQREYPPSLAGAWGLCVCALVYVCACGGARRHIAAAMAQLQAVSSKLPGMEPMPTKPDHAHEQLELGTQAAQPALQARSLRLLTPLLHCVSMRTSPSADCKDKFLVQCVKLGGNDAKEVTPDMFDAAKQKDIRRVPRAPHALLARC